MIVFKDRICPGLRRAQAFSPVPAIVAHGLGVRVLVQAIAETATATTAAAAVGSQSEAPNHRPHRHGVRGPGDLECQFLGFVLDGVPRNQAIDEAEVPGLFPRQGPSQQQYLGRLGTAQLAHGLEQMQGAHPGGNPQPAKGKSQDRPVPRCGHPQIAGQRQAGASSHRGSVEGANDRNGDLVPNAQKALVEAQHRVDVGVDGVLRQRVEPPEIAARRKGLVALPAQDDRANVLGVGIAFRVRELGFETGHEGLEFAPHFYRQGVVGLGRFEGDDSDRFVVVVLFDSPGDERGTPTRR
mmetsp:Transcript_18352/g.42131  ORF Transcript_18352/g.42131 Transcript_18352/m.42131 type:complete len:297 (-) Transcript_18352:324-1214(-)